MAFALNVVGIIHRVTYDVFCQVPPLLRPPKTPDTLLVMLVTASYLPCIMCDVLIQALDVFMSAVTSF